MTHTLNAVDPAATHPEPDYLAAADVAVALGLPDHSDPAAGPHPVNLLVQRLIDALVARWTCPLIMVHDSPLVSVADHYDRLGFTEGDRRRAGGHACQVSPTVMLRTHTAAAIPAVLGAWDREQDEGLIVVSGRVFHRQAEGGAVVSTHQADLWRVVRARPYGAAALTETVGIVTRQVLPIAASRLVPCARPYTVHGCRIDIARPPDGDWQPLAHCGVIAPALLADAGLNPDYWTGVALGLDLDRAVELRLAARANPQSGIRARSAALRA